MDKLYNPFIRKNDSTNQVMTDVVVALIPCMIMTWFAYGLIPAMVLLVAISSAVVTEFLFNALFSRNRGSLEDGSAIITGILLAFTIGPFTPLPVVAVGGASGVLFGKLLWGGLGKNRFNPALVGREVIVVFFPAIMNSSEIWSNQEHLNYSSLDITGNELMDNLVFMSSGAIGEYSPLFLILGGLYLLWRRRISWHIPFTMLVAFTIGLFLFRSEGISFSLGGLLLGAIYMATDMPTSSSNKGGKIYFGIMVGLIAFACILLGASKGYLSYSILIMNAFVVPINWIFRPRTWGKSVSVGKRIGEGALLTLAIAVTTGVVLWIHHAELLIYPVVGYMAFSIIRYALSEQDKPWAKLKRLRENR